MKKFKKFIKSKWHGIPLGAIAIALVASMAVTGSAYAAVTLLSGTASVTVNEAIVITGSTPTDGTWDGTTWTISTYPGETETLTLKITNAGSIGIPVTIAIQDRADFTEAINVWDGSAWVAYAGYTVAGTGYIQFTVTSSTSCPAGAYSFTIGITR
jgi:hypothetical protein